MNKGEMRCKRGEQKGILFHRQPAKLKSIYAEVKLEMMKKIEATMRSKR
jgi:hypothetical protein